MNFQKRRTVRETSIGFPDYPLTGIPITFLAPETKAFVSNPTRYSCFIMLFYGFFPVIPQTRLARGSFSPT